MINARGFVVLAFVVAAWTAGFCYGEVKERGRWHYWTASTVAFETKGDRTK